MEELEAMMVAAEHHSTMHVEFDHSEIDWVTTGKFLAILGYEDITLLWNPKFDK